MENTPGRYLVAQEKSIFSLVEFGKRNQIRGRVADEKEREGININLEVRSKIRRPKRGQPKGCDVEEGQRKDSVTLGLHSSHAGSDAVRRKGGGKSSPGSETLQ